MTTRQLVVKSQNGDDTAWRKLVKRYFDFIYYLAEKWLKPSRVEQESIDEVVVKLFMSLSRDHMAGLNTYKSGTFFPVFLRRRLLKVIKNFCRSNSIKCSFEHDFDEIDPKDAVENISDRETLAFTLYNLHQQSISEASEISGITGKRLSEIIGVCRDVAEEENKDESDRALEPEDKIEDEEDGKSTQQI